MARWDNEQEEYLLNHTNEEFLFKYPGRTDGALNRRRREINKRTKTNSEEDFRERMKKYMLEQPRAVLKFLVDRGKFSKIPASQLQNKDYIHEEYSLDNYIAYEK